MDIMDIMDIIDIMDFMDIIIITAWMAMAGAVSALLLILPFKVHADAINDLQYRGGKMATMSDMSLKIGHKVCF